MIVKEADDKTKDLETLKGLASRADCPAETRQKIEQEIRAIASGMKGEAEAAYEIGFHYGNSKNWMVLHDLRLECEGRVAQIDHLLINRFLEIYVCESKRFGEGVAINEQGEFAAFYGGKPYGVPSPLEQNKRHMAVLQSVFKTGMVQPPKRLGFTLTPSLHGLVLVSKNARISRPKAKINGLDLVIKADQLRARIDRDIEKDNNILGAAKLIGQDTLEEFARTLAAAHRPISFDWPAKFGLPVTSPLPTPMAEIESVQEQTKGIKPSEASAEPTETKKSKLVCCSCGESVTYNVAKFCWINKSRFSGKVFCFECQKAVSSGG